MMSKKKTEKKLMGFHLPLETQRRVRAAVYHTPGLTSDGLADMALNSFVDALEKRRGEKFSTKAVKLNPGRPIRLEN
jgi:hypothetical protein